MGQVCLSVGGAAPVSLACPIWSISAASQKLCTIWFSSVTASSIRMSAGPVVWVGGCLDSCIHVRAD